VSAHPFVLVRQGLAYALCPPPETWHAGEPGPPLLADHPFRRQKHAPAGMLLCHRSALQCSHSEYMRSLNACQSSNRPIVVRNRGRTPGSVWARIAYRGIDASNEPMAQFWGPETDPYCSARSSFRSAPRLSITVGPGLAPQSLACRPDRNASARIDRLLAENKRAEFFRPFRFFRQEADLSYLRIGRRDAPFHNTPLNPLSASSVAPVTQALRCCGSNHPRPWPTLRHILWNRRYLRLVEPVARLRQADILKLEHPIRV
jgi:hypothetical protein